MDSKQIKLLDEEYVLGTYGRAPVAIVKGKGLKAWDPEGNEYLDYTSGIGVNVLGFCDEKWSKAVAEQACTLQHISNLYYTEPGVKAAKTICERTGMSKVFFGNSGAEANEGLIKAARKYSADKYGEGRDVVITLINSFHGRTLATLTATGQDVFHHFFGPFNDGFVYVPANDIEALKAACEANKTCAVLMEMVQGEGGVMALDKAYVQAASAYCAEKDICFIVDEVQTGVGRTGTFVSWQQYDIVPDGFSMAKALGGGLPLGAVVLSEKLAAGMGKGTHGSTFGANPISCAAANVVLDTVNDAFMAEVREKAAYMRSLLAKLPHVSEVSGLGLMIGLKLTDGVTAGDVLAKCRENGLLVLTAKDRVRLLPPLVISKEEIEQGCAVLQKVLASF